MDKINDDAPLPEVGTKGRGKAINRPGFQNHGAIKARARTQILEALTANKGSKVGKKGLIFRILESIDADLDSQDAAIRRDARSDALKLAITFAKEDKSSSLEDLVKGGANVQINFNNYFKERQGIAGQELSNGLGIDIASGQD